MAADIPTPRTEIGDATRLTQTDHHFDFSAISNLPSPSKERNDLFQSFAGGRGASLKTPRGRTALRSLPNPSAGLMSEFTPLLKSAAKNRQYRANGSSDNKENGKGVPATPAVLKPGYVSHTPSLAQIDNSALYGENTSSSTGQDEPTPIPPAASSSAVSTPAVSLPKRGEGGVLHDGNMLTLREQEAKLVQIDKENFGLKLKIHFLEENLRRSGNDEQQATIQENTDLKVNRQEMIRELKQYKKGLTLAEKELEQYRQQLQDYADKVRRKHADAGQQEEIERLKIIVQQRETEVVTLKERLEEAGADEGHVEKLNDEIEDLQADLRERDRQLDEKDEQLENLKDKTQCIENDNEQVQNLREDLGDLENEIAEKDQLLDSKDGEISELKAQLENAHRRTQSAQKLRGDVGGLETKLREQEQIIEERDEEIRALEIRLDAEQAQHDANQRAHNEHLRTKEQQLEAKTGDLHAAEERLHTAREHWDFETQETETKLREKNRALDVAEMNLRDKARIIEDQRGEVNVLQKRLEAAEGNLDADSRKKSKIIQDQTAKISELQEQLRSVRGGFESQLREKMSQAEEQKNELQHLRNKLRSVQHDHDHDVRQKSQVIQNLEQALGDKTKLSEDQEQLLYSLQAKLRLVESPNSDLRKTSKRLEQQFELVQQLESQLRNTNEEYEERVQELELLLAGAKKEASDNAHKSERLKERLSATEAEFNDDQRDRSLIRNEQLERIQDLQDELHRAADGKEAELETLENRLRSNFATEKEDLEDEVLVLETSLEEAVREKDLFETKVRQLEQELQAAYHAKDTGTPIRERNSLLQQLQESQESRQALESQIATLEYGLSSAQSAKLHGSPVRERNELRSQLQDANLEIETLQLRVQELENEIQATKMENKIAEERHHLHDSLKEAKIRVEDLEMQLGERDSRLGLLLKKEAELKQQVKEAKAEVHELQREMLVASGTPKNGKVDESIKRELRDRTRELMNAKVELEDLQAQVAERKDSSSTRQRREAELRSQLRETRNELRTLQSQADAKDEQLQTAAQTEQNLLARLQRHKSGSRHAASDDLRAQLADSALEIDALQRRLAERDARIAKALKREEELRSRLQQARAATGEKRVGVQQQQQELQTRLEQKEATHAGELRGLVKQIQWLRAKCGREEAFRADLVYAKRFFLMQVSMYNAW